MRLYAAFAATRRYISSSAGFVYLFSSFRTSIFSRSLFFSLSVFSRRSPSRCTFVPTTLYHPAIISHTCHTLSHTLSLFLSHFLPQSTVIPSTPPRALPPLSRRYHAAFYKIYVCRRAGDVADRLFIFPVTVIFQTRTARWINVPGCF